MISKIIKKEKLIIGISVILFLLLFFISKSVPLTGDDWGSYSYRTNNIFKIITYAYSRYFIHEGRFFSRIFLIFFCNTKWLWNFVNAFAFSFLYYIMASLIGIKSKNNKILSLLLAMCMLILDNNMFTQIYLWVTGSCTYFFPMVFFLTYLFLSIRYIKDKSKSNIFIWFICILINIFTSMMVEHIAFTLVVANIILLGYQFYKTRSLDFKFLICLILSLTGALLMYFSPGAHLRMLKENIDFNNLSLYRKILHNIPNFVDYMYLRNSMLMFLIIIFNFLFVKKYSNNKSKYLYFVIFSIIPLLTIGLNLSEWFLVISSKARLLSDILGFIINPKNIFVISYWVFYSILIFYIVIKYFYKKNILILFFLILAFASNGVMLISPIWGGRTAALSLYLMYLTFFSLINDFQLKNKILFIVLCFSFFINVSVYIILYNSVNKQRLERTNTIAEQIKKINPNECTISYKRFPEYSLWNADAWDKFHQYNFKKYYKIPDNCELNRIPNGYSYFIFY